MIWLRRRLQLDRMGDERGMALAIAIVFGTVIVFMVTGAIAVATSGIRKSVSDADWNSALSAAYAGIQDYEARLSNDTGYTQYGNKDAPFSQSSRDLLTLPTSGATNPAFGTGASGTWATVQGDGDGRAQYRYEVDSSKYYSTGIVRVRSTGKVGNAVRSVVASVRQQGFVDFLYFTDYEIQDPVMSGVSVADCVKYAWQGRPVAATPGNRCQEIAFGGGDTIDGPAHSNDTMRICDATFTGLVTTSNPTSGVRFTAKDSQGRSCVGDANFAPGVTQPAFTSTIDMPATNAAQKSATRSDQGTGRVAGCLYTGPTKIVFNANGTMTVKSPYTRFTQTAGDGSTSGDNGNGCGQPGTAGGQLGSTVGATVDVPDNNLIYVQNIPTAASDVNTPRTQPSNGCNSGNGVGYPIANENQLSTSPCSYSPRAGDAFVQGTVSGQVTVAAENYIYATGDVKYGDTSADVLGLSATNAIQVWNPINTYSCGSSWNPQTCSRSLLGNDGREIDAAMISAAHTFQVQNSAYGGFRGTLKVVGAIAQKFRGIVSQNGNGYVKNYVYDARLKHTAPPKFLNPVTTTYGLTSVGEVSPAYLVSGACATASGGGCV